MGYYKNVAIAEDEACDDMSPQDLKDFSQTLGEAVLASEEKPQAAGIRGLLSVTDAEGLADYLADRRITMESVVRVLETRASGSWFTCLNEIFVLGVFAEYRRHNPLAAATPVCELIHCTCEDLDAYWEGRAFAKRTITGTSPNRNGGRGRRKSCDTARAYVLGDAA